MADQKDVDTVVNHFMQCEDFCSVEYFTAVKQFARIYIIDVDDGWFEVYAPTDDWLRWLRACWPDTKYIDSNKWQREQ